MVAECRMSNGDALPPYVRRVDGTSCLDPYHARLEVRLIVG